ncbi:activator-dependent family glycosyltransferase [Streptosporangium sp. NPDC049046]|uniref:activator-dependent family glycosyltransferase n=1 Tax=Streptosporangium sp. NPDC049046 TaxID=3155031 RepID=UPI0034217C04
MRILFATYAEKSHFLVMVPLAWALQAEGHEVRVASQPDLTDVITRSGLTAVPVGRDHSLWRANRAFGFFDPRKKHKRAVPFFDMADDHPEQLTWEHFKRGYAQFVPWWCRLVNEPMIDGLTEYCRRWEPDLVIWEPVTYAGPIAAKACGAVHARFMWSLDLFGRMRGHYLRAKAEQPPQEREDMLQAWIAAHGRRFGVEFSEEMTTGHFTIDYTPPSLELPPDPAAGPEPHRVPVRFIPYNDRAVIPPWLRVAPERPRVCLTLGTTSAENLDGYLVPVQEILDGLADLDVEIVATLPEHHQAQLERVPDNVRLVSFVPLHALLPTCTAVIDHGGSGTFFTTLASGVPQLVLPNLFDEPLRARYLAEQGAGLTMHSSEATGAGVRQALLRLLEEPSFAEESRRIRDEMNAMPAPAEVAAGIEALVETYRAAVPAAGR